MFIFFIHVLFGKVQFKLSLEKIYKIQTNIDDICHLDVSLNALFFMFICEFVLLG